MQQICHQLRTGGDMEFEEISQVVPWIELEHDQGQDLEAEQVAPPRCFKTHCWYDHCPICKMPAIFTIFSHGGSIEMTRMRCGCSSRNLKKVFQSV